jgi:hypothetical protein
MVIAMALGLVRGLAGAQYCEVYSVDPPDGAQLRGKLGLFYEQVICVYSINPKFRG